MVVNILSQGAGLRVATGQAKKFNSKHHTFLSKRFDRTNNGMRIHFASAMTLLGYPDANDGISYVNLAEFIMQYGSGSEQDLMARAFEKPFF